MKTEILRVRNAAVKGSDGFCLKNLNICICKGETLGLFAHDGREQQLFIDLLCGRAEPFSGFLFYRGKLVENGMRHNPETAVITRSGGLIEDFTVWENILIFRNKGRGTVGLKESFLKNEAQEQLAEHGLELGAERKVGSLSMAERYMVEILKAHLTGAELIVIDEFTFDVPSKQFGSFLHFLQRLKEEGVAFVIGRCRLERLNRLSDRTAFLNEGSIIQVMENRREYDSVIKQMKETILDTGRGCLQKDPVAGGDTVYLNTRVHYNGIEICLPLKKGEVTLVLDMDGTGREIMGQCSGKGCWNIGQTKEGIHRGSKCVELKSQVLVLPEFESLLKIFHSLSISENICLKLNRKYFGSGWIRKRFEHFVGQSFLEWSGREESFLSRGAETLTDAERALVGLYRIRMQKPSVLVCRDPMGGTEGITGYFLLKKIRDMAEGGTAVCIFLSNQDCPADIGDRYFWIENSCLKELRYEELKSKLMALPV